MRSLSRVFLGAVSILSLMSGSAHARPILADASHELGVYPSAYANFLIGRVAMSMGDVTTASSALEAASAGDPQNADLRRKAFLVAMLGGDIEQAQTMTAGFAPGQDSNGVMVHTLGAVIAIKAGHAGSARKELDAAVKIDAGDRTAAMLRPYVLAMDGETRVALDDSGDAALEKSDSNRLIVYFIRAERARIQELAGHPAEAEAIYKTLYQPGAASIIFGPDYAGFLERQGRKDEARAVWRTIATLGGDPAAEVSLRRLDGADYAKPVTPTLRQSMAQALFLSSTLYYSDREVELALADLRLSLYLDPTSDRQHIFLGQIEQDLKDPEAAEAAWAAVPASSPLYGQASLLRIASLRGRDQADDALNLVNQNLAADPDNLGFTIEKAGLLQAQNDDTDALAVVNARISRAGDKDFTWQAWFMQASLYDGLNRWDEAETAIKKAQAINATQPEILNFLGYGWINRGLHVKEGMDLVRQAINIDPKSGPIIDSLGWGYYKMGDYGNALNYAEQAVQMSPSDAEINDHLGDVYKALGRDVEAGYEWQRVLTLDVPAAEADSVRQKIETNDAALKVKGLAPAAVPAKATADIVLPRKRHGGFGRA